MLPSHNSLASPFFTLLLFLSISFTFSFPHTGQTAYQDLDLYFSDTSTFAQEAVYWGLSGFIGSSTTSTCNGIPILGGPSVIANNGYFTKTEYSLTTHDVIYFRIEFYIIDNWQSTDTVTVSIDGTNFTIGDMTTVTPVTDLCGDPNYPDVGLVTFMGRLDHTNSQAVVKIISNINTPASQASFGIRHFNMLFGTKSGSEPPMACNIASLPGIDKSCGCPVGQYADPLNSNQCTPCDPNCADCFGPSTSECFACNTTTGSSFVNNACFKCYGDCVDCMGPFANQCLKCRSNVWTKWDNTCPTTCSSPAANQVIMGDVNLCEPPCPQGDFYVSNSSCSTACPSVLGQYSNNFGKFCALACSGSDNFHLNNNSCDSICTSPYIGYYLDDVLLVCDKPCPAGQYVYPDGSCSNNCSLPLVNTTELGVDKCNSPCTDPTLPYYDNTTQTCVASCTSPYIPQQETWYQQCVLGPSTPSSGTDTTQSQVTTLSDSDAKQVRVASSIVDNGGTVMAIASTMAIAFGSTNPAVGTIGAFVKMLPYIRYIGIAYPAKLQAMLDNLNSTLISFSFSIPLPNGLQEDFHKRPLPHLFDRYQYHSSFFLNYWQTMTALGILLCAIVFLIVITSLVKRNKELHHLFEGIKLIFQWNFFFMIFCNNFDSVILGTSLEMRTVQFDSASSVFSFLWCIFVNCMAIYVLCLIVYIVKDIRKKKRQVFPGKKVMIQGERTPSPETKWKKFQLFFKGSKDTSFSRHAFMLPFLVRIYLFNFIIAHFYTAPLAQAILIVTLSASMLLTMLLLKPFVSSLVFVQHCTDEIIMLTVNSCMLGLAILDAKGVTNQDLRENLGNVIIYCNVAFSFTANMYLGAYLYVGFKAAYENSKANKGRGAVYWLIALLAPYESGGMDMELAEKEDLVKGDPDKEDKEDLPLPTSSTRVNEMNRNLLFPNDLEGRRTSITLHNRRDSLSTSTPGTKQDLFENAQTLLLKNRKPSLSIQVQIAPMNSQNQNVSPTVSPNNGSMVSQYEGSPFKMSSFARNSRPSVHVEPSSLLKEDVILTNPNQGNSTDLIFSKARRSRRYGLEQFLAVPERNNSPESPDKSSLDIE